LNRRPQRHATAGERGFRRGGRLGRRSDLGFGVGLAYLGDCVGWRFQMDLGFDGVARCYILVKEIPDLLRQRFLQRT
jgi:hypothetical protein